MGTMRTAIMVMGAMATRMVITVMEITVIVRLLKKLLAKTADLYITPIYSFR